MKLSGKINLLVIGIATAFALSISILMGLLIQDYAEQEQGKWARSLANTMAEGIALDTINLDAIAAREQLLTLVREEPTLAYAYIYDFDNRLFAHSFDAGFPRFLLELHSTQGGNTELSRRYSTTDGEILELANPLIEDMAAQLYIGLNQSSTQAAVHRARLEVFAVALVITVPGALLALLIGRRISRPLQQLTQQVADFGTGSCEAISTPETSSQEVTELAHAFESMASSRAAAYREKAEREQHLSRTLDSIGDAVIVTDSAGSVVRLNPIAEILTGWRSKEACNQPLSVIFRIVNALTGEPQPDPVSKVMLTGKIVGLANHTVLISRTGKEYQIADSGAPILNESGETVGVILVFRDVSEEYRLQSEIRRHREHLQELVEERTGELEQSNRALLIANKELEAFSFAVSHDLRAPLRAIDGYSNALMDDYRDQLSDGAVEYLQRIVTGAHRMGELIDALLLLSRVVRQEIVRRQVDMSLLAEEIVQQLRSGNPEHAVDVEIQPNLQVMADEQLLRILLENLLGNAWKYSASSEQPRIQLVCELQDGEKQFCICDNGVGFDNQYNDKLFKAFHRLHGTEFEGTGIGLATAERIVHRLGGRIWGQGEENKGAIFCFTLDSSPGLKLVGGAS